jgi:microcystin-dependent protein
VEFVSDVSFSGTIGHAGGVGNALEVTTDLSVNGDFRVSDASFAHVGALVSGSNVEFVSDVSFDGSIVAVDASFTGKVDIQSLGGNAIVSSISTGEAANDKVASISAIKNYFNNVLDISAFFFIDENVLRPTIESSGNKIGGFDQKALVFVNDISADANLYVGGDVSLNQKLYVVGDIIADGDVSFNAHLSAMDASFHQDVTVLGNLYVDGSFNFGEVIKNITTVNNELLISTQVDISNHGTGPALKVSQYGDNAGDKLAVFNAGEQGLAFEIMYDGDSVFHKDVSFQDNVGITGKLVVDDKIECNGNIDLRSSLDNGNEFIGYGTVPIGGIIIWNDYNSVTTPDGWALCDGQNDTPDLRGKFIMSSTYGSTVALTGGQSNYSVGQKGGKQYVTLTEDEMPSHTHKFTFDRFDGGPSDPDDQEQDLDSDEDEATLRTYTRDTQGTGGDGAHENRPPYYVLAYIMRIK